MNRTNPRTKCRYHCVPCGTHFHSLHAFDTHRQGDHASNDPELGRHCVHPLDILDRRGQMRLEALTDVGICDIREVRREPVTIWTLRMSPSQKAGLERLTASRRSSQGGPNAEGEGPDHP